MRTPPDERLTAVAAEAERVRQLRAFTGWVGTGRKLTQTGRVTLADARKLVVLLGTKDTLDPSIGDRVFRTKSSEELPGISTVVAWAKACRLVRVTDGRLVGAENSSTSCDLGIFVDQPAQTIDPHDPQVGCRSGRRDGSIG